MNHEKKKKKASNLTTRMKHRSHGGRAAHNFVCWLEKETLSFENMSTLVQMYINEHNKTLIQDEQLCISFHNFFVVIYCIMCNKVRSCPNRLWRSINQWIWGKREESKHLAKEHLTKNLATIDMKGEKPPITNNSSMCVDK